MKKQTVVSAPILTPAILALAIFILAFTLPISIPVAFAGPPNSTLSNGLTIDASGNLLINAGGGGGSMLSNGLSIDSSGRVLVTCTGCSSAQSYPAAGIANSTGTAWGTSYTTTGSGTVVALATSPTLVTPVLGVASGTSLALGGGTALTTTNQTGTGSLVLANSATLVTPAIGAATGTSLALGGGTALTTTNQTGTGNLVLATSPTLVTPALGAATATSINKLTLTQPATGSTLTLADGKTLTVSNTLALSGTDATTITFPSTSVSVAGNSSATAHNFGLYEGTGTAQTLLSCGAGTTVQGASAADPTCTAVPTNGVQNTTQGTLTLAGSAASAGSLTLNIAGATANGTTIVPGANTAPITLTLPIATGTLTYSVATMTNNGIVSGVGTAKIQASSNILTNGSLFTTMNGVVTAGQGVPEIYGATSQKAETGSADASVLAYTPAASAGMYRACLNASVSAATSGVIGWTLSWTDSNGAAQSNIAESLYQAGTAAPALTFTTSVAGNYDSCHTFDINNAAAAITVKWVGGGTTTAKVSASIERVQ